MELADSRHYFSHEILTKFSPFFHVFFTHVFTQVFTPDCCVDLSRMFKVQITTRHLSMRILALLANARPSPEQTPIVPKTEIPSLFSLCKAAGLRTTTPATYRRFRRNCRFRRNLPIPYTKQAFLMFAPTGTHRRFRRNRLFLKTVAQI